LRREVDSAGGVVSGKNFPRDIAVASNFLAVTKIATAQKPLIHRHFCIPSIFAQDIARAQNFFASGWRGQCNCASPANAGPSGYTQNLVE
jgi:hypothetical protein